MAISQRCSLCVCPTWCGPLVIIIIIIVIIRQLIRRRNMSMKSLQRRRTAYATRIKVNRVMWMCGREHVVLNDQAQICAAAA